VGDIVATQQTQSGIFTFDMTALNVERRDLRDNHIRTDSAIANIAQQFSNLDRHADSICCNPYSDCRRLERLAPCSNGELDTMGVIRLQWRNKTEI
jgi:hypothetical protein